MCIVQITYNYGLKPLDLYSNSILTLTIKDFTSCFIFFVSTNNVTYLI